MSQPAVMAPGVERINPLRAALVCLAAAILPLVLPRFEHGWLYLIVGGLFLCLAGPIAFRWVNGDLDYFEPIHLFGFVYFIYFGLGAIWTVNDPRMVAYDRNIPPYIPQAAFYCLLGYLALLVGYFGPGHRKVFRAPSEWPRNSVFLFLVGGLGLAGFLAVGAMEGKMSSGGFNVGISMLSQLYPLFIYAWAMAWMLFYSERTPLGQRFGILAFIACSGFIVAFVTFSDKSMIMTLLGLPVISRWYVKRRIPWTFLIVLVLILVFVVFPFYNAFRWMDPNKGHVERMGATYDMIQDWSAERYMMFSVTSAKRRLAMINSVAIVVRDAGRWVPYAHGSTIFMPMASSFVPRLLWPDKPTSVVFRDFGRRFRVTNYFSRNVYIAVTVPGELYWNFHLPGIIVGMGLFGYVMRWVYRRFGSSPGLDPGRRAMFVLVLFQFIHFHGQLAVDVVLLVRLLILLTVIRFVARRVGLLAPDAEAGTEAVPAGA